MLLSFSTGLHSVLKQKPSEIFASEHEEFGLAYGECGCGSFAFVGFFCYVCELGTAPSPSLSLSFFSPLFLPYCCCLYLTFSFWVQFLSSLSMYFINLFRKEINMSQNVFISFFLLNNNVTSSVKLLSWVISFQC